MKSKWQTTRGLLCVMLLSVTLLGCATKTTGSAVTDTGHAGFCDVAKPIYWSKADSLDTIEQAKEHNAVGVRLCGWGSKGSG